MKKGKKAVVMVRVAADGSASLSAADRARMGKYIRTRRGQEALEAVAQVVAVSGLLEDWIHGRAGEPWTAADTDRVRASVQVIRERARVAAQLLPEFVTRRTRGG